MVNEVDYSCSTTSIYPEYVFYIINLIYFICIFIAGIRSFIQLKKTKDEWSKLKCHKKFINIMKDLLRKKKCYLELFPHIIDTATDIGVLIEFYHIAINKKKNKNICKSLNMISIFIISCSILLIYRIISSIQIYLYLNF